MEKAVKTWANRVAWTGAVLVLASVAMLLIGNRWANYVVTPIPGLYLVDALFVAGSFLGVASASVLKSSPRWLWWLFGILWSYVSIALVPEFLFIPASDRYDALRDAAPFLYLSLAPFAAVTLMTVSSRILVSMVRWSSLIAAAIGLLTSIGFLRPFSSPLLGSEFAQFFGLRPDLLGAAIGIGILAWGQWPASQLQRSFAVQGALLLVGVAIIGNRSGLIALLTVATIAVIREVRSSRSLLAPTAAVGLVLGGFAVQLVGLPTLGTNDSTVVTSTPQPAVTSTPEPGTVEQWFQDVLVKPGTTNARLATWTDIVDGMTKDGTWLVGGSAGSDYMYELCTGIPEAPDFILTGPKCAVDSRGLQPVVRDPHNWILNIVLYHGVLGLTIFIATLTLPSWRARNSPDALLPIGGILAYLASGMTFLISAGYALIPISFFIAWLVRNTLQESSSPTRSEHGLGLHRRS